MKTLASLPAHVCRPELSDREAIVPAKWWRQWQFWMLAILTAAIYFSRIADLPIRGEETRRAMVAWEILQTGDWIVPRQQSQPFLSRPPVGSWPIAWLAQTSGDLSLVAVRLPSILATLLTVLLVYVYCLQFLSPLGALSAGLACATFIQMLQLGRVAESETLFTFLLGGSLLIWHWGYTRRWPAWRTWCAAYALVAIATLVKSVQAPVYFCGAVGLYLLWQRQGRSLLSAAHLAGCCVFLAIVAAWQIPFYRELGWPAVWKVWSGDVGIRFQQLSPTIVVTHVLTFPLQVLGCLLPWSLLLPAYFRPQFRRAIGRATPLVAFAVCAWLVSLPTCWLVPNARPRYLMPLYPLAAGLIGLVVERTFESGLACTAVLRRGWRWFTSGAVFSLFGGAAAVALASWIFPLRWPQIAQPTWFAAMYVAVASAAAIGLLGQMNQWTRRAATVAVLTMAALMGLTASGVAVNSSIALDPHSGQQVAQLKQRLPPQVRLVSFGQVETMFSYHWRQPIAVISPKPPQRSTDVPGNCDYFCFNSSAGQLPRLPFPWRVEALIDCDRAADDPAGKVVVVGRRVDAVTLLPDDATIRR